MKALIFCLSLIRSISRIVPFQLRREWVQEWEAEVVHCLEQLEQTGSLNRTRAMRVCIRCFGAIPDALWLRRHDWSTEMFLQDIRISVRGLIQRPAFSGVVILVLALGIGANTAVFSVVNSVLLRPLPFPDPDRLVMLWDISPDPSRPKDGPSPGNVIDWREKNTVFDGLAAWYASQPLTYQTDNDAEKVQTAKVTTDFFKVFGRDPVIGRTFDAPEVERQDRVVVVGHDFWQRRFNGDPGVIGKSIILDQVPHQVIGVMPADFSMPAREVNLWVPWDFRRGYSNLPAVPRDFRFLRVAARLKPGVSLAQAQANMDGIGAELQEFPVNKGWSTRIVYLSEEIVGNLRPVLLVLFGAVGFVLLIACTNISNLLLARMSGRGRELAVRSAIGASRFRLITQLLTESMTLSLAGGLAGLAVAYLATRVLISVAPLGLPRFDEVSIDANVLAFATVLSLLTGVVFGILPSLHFTRRDVSTILKDNSSGGGTGKAPQRIRNGLVVCEIAAAFTLLAGAGLLIQSFRNVMSVDPGFNEENVLVMRVFPDAQKYKSGEQRLNYFATLTEKLRALPSVQSVGATTGLPMNKYNNAPMRPSWREDRPVPTGGPPEAQLSMVTVDYFKTMSIHMLRGRDFNAGDRDGSLPVVIINDTLARNLWGSEDPVGENLVINYAARGIYPYEVVGVVQSTRSEGLRISPEPEMFLPHAQVPYATMNMVVRTDGDPLRLLAAARRVVLELDATQPVYSITTMQELMSTTVARDRFSMLLLGVLAALALVLATTGIYSVMSFTVSQRTREIGIRVALGARSRDVTGLVFRQGSTLVATGVGIGLIAAFALTRTMSALLYNVHPLDPATFVGVPVLLTATALLASYIPARLATKVDPIQALRKE